MKIITFSVIVLFLSNIVYAKSNLENSIIGNGEKIIHLKNIEYVKGKSYNYHDYDWNIDDKYRVIRKNNELIGAYNIDKSTPTGEIGVMYMTKYIKDIQLARSIIKKGKVDFSHYMLECNKEFSKQTLKRNKYTQFNEFEDDSSPIEISKNYAIYKDLELICKHTYIDNTNGIREIWKNQN
ncbi:hypothetical protein [Acinetobacter wuhouensis]|uniref:Uncharacterized protein n=1 Tax=Acinetobacter wuhouensis TaxID=1879050 RepID=A0A3G2T0C4_9GAMM|nr:hypothetical protein [Acinetobacter wuhouensis]AYO53613.1 hypothetical protein CDG68_08175 [Acinetobacter wuhouensis]